MAKRGFACISHGAAEADLLFDGWIFGRIRDLSLQGLRLSSKSNPLLGPGPGMPLYWRQYAGHEIPENSCRYGGAVRCSHADTNLLILSIFGRNGSGSVHSDYEVFCSRGEGDRIQLEVRATVTIPDGRSWRIDPNPSHGEVTFCTLWPADVFSLNDPSQSRFSHCLLHRREGTIGSISLHHAETPDKNNILMEPGDSFCWASEEENPVVELLEGSNVEAGLCAYMWDAHFGIRFNLTEEYRTIAGPLQRSVLYRISSIPLPLAREWLSRASPMKENSLAEVPVWNGGRHSFRDDFSNTEWNRRHVWPWQHGFLAVNSRSPRFLRDTRCGCGDCYSLRIDLMEENQAWWMATTLGPAFGEPPFLALPPLRLRAVYRTSAFTGQVWLTLRLRETREGKTGEEHVWTEYHSPIQTGGSPEWRPLELCVPLRGVSPDRVHLLLQAKGRGTVWFDDVELHQTGRGSVASKTHVVKRQDDRILHTGNASL